MPFLLVWFRHWCYMCFLELSVLNTWFLFLTAGFTMNKKTTFNVSLEKRMFYFSDTTITYISLPGPLTVTCWPPLRLRCLTVMAHHQSPLDWMVFLQCSALPRERWSPCRPTEPLSDYQDTKKKVGGRSEAHLLFRVLLHTEYQNNLKK